MQWLPRTAPLLLLLALLAAGSLACGCPPKLVDYTSPEATLRTWQAHLCHDLPEDEYACFSADFARSFGGYGNYLAFRDHLIADQPVLSYIVERKDLSDNIVGFGIEPDGIHGWAILQALSERLRLDFVREVWVTITFRDGRKPVRSRQRVPFSGMLNLSGTRQWLLIDRPDLDPDDIDLIESISFDSRWLIDRFGAEVSP